MQLYFTFYTSHYSPDFTSCMLYDFAFYNIILLGLKIIILPDFAPLFT